MIDKLLIKHRSSIIDSWIRSIYSDYPPETSNFLNLQKNRFSNPVGYIIKDSAEKIYDELIGGNEIEKIKSYLEDIIKIKAVQDFTPSQAVGFVFSLKGAVYREIEQYLVINEICEELIRFESAVDQIALAAFDLYTASREKIYNIRINEMRAQLFGKKEYR